MKRIIKNFIKAFIPTYLRRFFQRIARKTPLIRERAIFLTFSEINDRLYKSFSKQCEISSNSDLDSNASISIETLHKNFHKYKVRSRNLPDEWWKDVIASTRLPHGLGEKATYKVAIKSKEIGPEKLETQEWLHIFTLLSRVGLFLEGYFVRDLARNCALLKKDLHANDYEQKKIIAAAIELKNFDKAKTRLSKLEKKKKFKKLSCFSIFIMDVYSGCYKPNEKMSRVDKEFHNYINGRSIAVVGPAETNVRDAGEIDSFDRIVRLNYFRSGKGCDAEYNGLRCDITYFSGAQFHALTKTKRRIPSEVSWVIFKHPFHKKIYEAQEGKVKRENLRVCNENKWFFNGSLTLLPNAVLDILRYQPLTIKIFHADLMLTVKKVSGYYPCPIDEMYGKDDKIELFLNGSVLHDRVTQYSLLNNLWKSNCIDGDQRFFEVMNIGCEEYMRQLQIIYGSGHFNKNRN